MAQIRALALVSVLFTATATAQVTLPPGGSGADGSFGAPTIGTVTQTFAPDPNRSAFYIETFCGAYGPIQVILDHAAGPSTIILVGLTPYQVEWSLSQSGIHHTGAIRIASPAGCSYSAGEW